MADTFENVAHAITALGLVAEAIKARKTEMQGTGFIVCPKCAGELRFSFQRRRASTRALSYAAQCESAGCLTFQGH